MTASASLASTLAAVTVIPDTPTKRREYEEEIVRTFYLSNADLKETVDLLRIVVDARRISSVSATNAIAIKDTPDRVAAASRLIAAIDKARPEGLTELGRVYHLHREWLDALKRWIDSQ